MTFTQVLDAALRAAALATVHFYRKNLSALKGYRCAYGQATGRGTCSGVGLRGFQRAGFFKGLALLQRQFDRCALAAHAQAGPEADDDTGGYARLHPLAQHGQGGFIDCDPGCDIVDIPGELEVASQACLTPQIAAAGRGAMARKSFPALSSARTQPSLARVNGNETETLDAWIKAPVKSLPRGSR